MTPAAVVSAQQRFRARRRAAGRRRLRLAVTLVLGVIALGVGGWLVLNSSLVELRTVTVDGTSRLSVGDVIAAADVQRGESLARLDPAAVARRVDRLPAVAAADVVRRWPHGLVIHVTERSPVAAVPAAGGGAILLDRFGVPFARTASAPAGLVPVRVGGTVTVRGSGEAAGPGNAEARAAMSVLRALPAGVRQRVTGVRARSPYAVSLQLRGGRSVVWGSPAESATKARVLQVLLRRPARVYDVSAPTVAATR